MQWSHILTDLREQGQSETLEATTAYTIKPLGVSNYKLFTCNIFFPLPASSLEK